MEDTQDYILLDKHHLADGAVLEAGSIISLTDNQAASLVGKIKSPDEDSTAAVETVLDLQSKVERLETELESLKDNSPEGMSQLQEDLGKSKEEIATLMEDKKLLATELQEKAKICNKQMVKIEKLERKLAK